MRSMILHTAPYTIIQRHTTHAAARESATNIPYAIVLRDRHGNWCVAAPMSLVLH